MTAGRGRRSAPGRKDRGGSHTRARVVVGMTHAVAPPPLTEGKTRCPMCRNVTTLTTTGRLRQHRDLFGNDCPNRAAGNAPQLDELPPVVLPPEPVLVTVEEVQRPAPERNPSRLDIGSSCQECGKWIPGERRLCGRCFALGGRP